MRRKIKRLHYYLLGGIALLFLTCNDNESNIYNKENLGFSQLPSTTTQVDFINKLNVEELKSYYAYINIFNGGGVALGDINNDGLEDIYLTGNQVDNKLYINKGNFVFEDVTVKAGVKAKGKWSNGPVITDINNDGWNDIYVCHSYHNNEVSRANSLFLNMKDGTFKEVASPMGIGDNGYSICASFFDYDRDGDNDLFVGNHGTSRGYINPDEHLKNWVSPPGETSDRLYRNDGNLKFTDVTQESGILNYGWTLSAITADFNSDGWPDIYVGIDHEVPDKLYINQKDGTFKDEIKSRFGHVSFSCMGADIGDINNDGLQDLFTVDMLSKDNFLEKSEMGSMNVEGNNRLLKKGMHVQQMRNSLQLNRGGGYYSEIGQITGLERTEWSWATLFLDVDNNGYEDIFVTNGYYKGMMNKDWRKKFKTKISNAEDEEQFMEQYIALVKGLKPSPFMNELYTNSGNLHFANEAEKLGLNLLGFTSGAAYGDLDNDGDLDLVINNLDELATIYKNKSIEGNSVLNNFVSFQLDEYVNNDPQGAEITIFLEDDIIKTKSYLSSRGYISGMGKLVHFGLGEVDKINNISVHWPNGITKDYGSLEANNIHTLSFKLGKEKPLVSQKANTILRRKESLKFTHIENDFDDYAHQVLLPHKMSQFGPIMCKGDVNGDGIDDLFIGGSKSQSGAIFIQNVSGDFKRITQIALKQDAEFEDLGAALLDVDGDNDLDLYVSSGGNEFPSESEYYQNRLYLNNGGEFVRAKDHLPNLKFSTGRVTHADFDKDGDYDLFVCGKQSPHEYPKPTTSYLLENDGNGNFTKEKSTWDNIGMCSDAVFTDVNIDGDLDLILVGDWMPIRVYLQKQGSYVESTEDFGIAKDVGWWNRIIAEDMDGDGRDDYIIGNLGENYKYRASTEKPFHVFADDFDSSGTFDIALGYHLNGETLFPVRGKQCSSEQVPDIAQKFTSYDDYGKASIFDVYGDRLNRGLHYKANNFSHVFIDNKEDGFTITKLPRMSQLSPIFGISVNDYTGDGKKDILMAGNLFVAEIETGQADAGKGVLLSGNGKNDFEFIPNALSGFVANGDVRDLIDLKGESGGTIIIGVNEGEFVTYKY